MKTRSPTKKHFKEDDQLAANLYEQKIEPFRESRKPPVD